MFLATVLLAGCERSSPRSPEPPPGGNSAAPTVEPDAETAAEPEPPPVGELDQEPEATIDLGPPLVEDAAGLTRLDPVKPLWLDPGNKRVVMVGQVCQTDAPLEMFACLRNTKEHEAVVTVDVVAMAVHAGLLHLGAKVGGPVRFDPGYVPASGTEIEVTILWKNQQGERQTARAQDWILDPETGQAMAHPWVFAGSGFWEDERTGQKYYQADGGDFICVSNFPSAMLDLPIESSQADSQLLFRAFTERIPPLGTPVTLVLTPKLDEAVEAH